MNNYPVQFNEGKVKEKDFVSVAQRNNFETSNATTQQDIYEHWDIKISKSYKVDVKGLKKIRRADLNLQEDLHYIYKKCLLILKNQVFCRVFYTPT